MDTKKLVGDVAAQYGLQLKPDDPAFWLLMVNQVVLETAIRELVVQVRTAIAEFESASDRVQSRTGEMLAVELHTITTQLRRSADREGSPGDWRLALRWVCVGIVLGLVLLAIGAWVGHLPRSGN